MTPRKCATLIQQLPAGAQFYRALGDTTLAWTDAEHLAAIQADYLALLMWAKTEDGSRNRNRPTPTPRPGVEAETDSTTYGSEPLPTDELDAWLAARTDPPQEVPDGR